MRSSGRFLVRQGAQPRAPPARAERARHARRRWQRERLGRWRAMRACERLLERTYGLRDASLLQAPGINAASRGAGLGRRWSEGPTDARGITAPNARTTCHETVKDN